MRASPLRFALAVIFSAVLWGPAAKAAPAEAPAAIPKTLKVGLNHIPPYVLLSGAAPTGYAVELWERLAKDAGLSFEFVRQENLAASLKALTDGQQDAAVGGISVTAARERTLDFSHAIDSAGLGIAVREGGEEVGWFERVFSAISHTRMGIVVGFLLLIVVSGHLIWLAERGKDAFNDKYAPGVFEGMYWAIVTASTVGYGDKAPVKWAGRVLAGVVIIISLPMFALFTAELTSAITVEDMRSQISGPEDLRSRPVAVVTGTTSATFAARHHLRLVSVPNVQDAYEKLAAGKVDAIIYDAPTLRYYAHTGGLGTLRVLPTTFDAHDIAFAFPEGSALQETVNRALLRLEESGQTAHLRMKWFGASE